jgi:hypothetical protein
MVFPNRLLLIIVTLRDNQKGNPKSDIIHALNVEPTSHTPHTTDRRRTHVRSLTKNALYEYAYSKYTRITHSLCTSHRSQTNIGL